MATVLVVDDEHGIAEMIDVLLTTKGHRVLTAINGKHGLEMLAQKQVDLVFLDFMMPVMDGAAMLRFMKADPIWQKIPVVLMSALPGNIIAQRCSGYVGFLRKPFQTVQIETLAEYLGRLH